MSSLFGEFKVQRWSWVFWINVRIAAEPFANKFAIYLSYNSYANTFNDDS